METKTAVDKQVRFQGRPSAVIEVRRCAVESFSGVSKKSGRRETFHKLVIGGECIGDGSPIICDQFLPEGATQENTQLPFVRGDVIAVEIASCSTKQGIRNCGFTNVELLSSSVKGAAKN